MSYKMKQAYQRLEAEKVVIDRVRVLEDEDRWNARCTKKEESSYVCGASDIIVPFAKQGLLHRP